MSVPTNPPGNTSELPRQNHLTNVTLSVNLTDGQYDQLMSTEYGSSPEPDGISSETYTMFVEQAAKQEEEFIKARNSDLETLLLFATLFSAVLTAFVIESYKNLQADPSAETLEILQRILIATQTNSDAIDTTPSLSASGKFKPTSSALRVNGFWFASLVISVSTAFLAILAKQWLLGVTESLSPDLDMRARQHQHRLGNMEKWKMSVVLAVIPVLLHLSLLLFFAGLIDFLWSINVSIAIVSASLAGVTVLFYFATHITSIIWLSSPYRTSLTSLGVALSNMIRIVLYHAISNPLIGSIIRFLLINLLRIISRTLRLISKDQELSDRLLDLFRPLYEAWGAERSQRKGQSTVTTKFASLTAPRISEEQYIRDHQVSIDADILAALISRFPRWQNHSQTNTLAVDVFRFKNLLEYKTMFLGAGAVSLLSRYIHSSTVAGPNEAQAGMLVKQWDVLCRLITEPHVEEGEDIPSPDDIDSDQWESQSEASRSIVSSGLCVRDAPLIDTEDLHLFSTTLRLQVLVSDLNLYEQTVGASIATFYERLGKLEASHLDSRTGALLSAVNTTIFISLQRIVGSHTSYEEDIPMRRQHTLRGLEVLTAILSSRLTMPFHIKRQICWATYFLSDPERYCTPYPLVPTIRNVNKLSGRLSSLISSDSSSVVLYSALTILESLLYSGSRADGVHRNKGKKEYAQLIRALTEKYTRFIKTIRATPELISSWSPPSSSDILSGNEQSSTVPQIPDPQLGPARTSCPSAPPGAADTKQDYLPRLVNCIVRISGCLGFYAMERNTDEEPEDEEPEDEESEDEESEDEESEDEESQVVDYLKLERQQRQEIISNTLTFLQNVCAQSSSLSVPTQEDVWRTYYGTMRQMVHLQMGNWMLRPSGSRSSPFIGPTNQPTVNLEASAPLSSVEDRSHNAETDDRKPTHELPPPIDGFTRPAEPMTFESLAEDLVSSLEKAAGNLTNAPQIDIIIMILPGIALLSKAPRVGPRDRLVRYLRQPTVYDTVSRLVGSTKAAVSQPITGSPQKDDDVLRAAATEASDALDKLFTENSTPAPGVEAAGSAGHGAHDMTATNGVKYSDRSFPLVTRLRNIGPRMSRPKSDIAGSAPNSPRNETTTANNRPVLPDPSSAPSPSSFSEPRPAIPHHDTSRTAVETSQDDESFIPKVTPAPTPTPDVSDMV